LSATFCGGLLVGFPFHLSALLLIYRYLNHGTSLAEYHRSTKIPTRNTAGVFKMVSSRQDLYSGTSLQVEPSSLSQTGFQRARVACRVCREKKIRCDVREGEPCSNCALDNIQCILVPKKSRRQVPGISSIFPSTNS
jgi:hypothetical protein